MVLRIFLNILSSRGFVKKSANILVVEQKATFALLFGFCRQNIVCLAVVFF